MKTLTFDEVVKLINYSRVTKITESPIKSEANKWSLFYGVNKVPHFEYPFNVLYLYSDATKESMARAVKAISDPESTQVVYAQSLSKWTSDMRSVFHGRCKGMRTTKEYLTLFIKDQLSGYQQKLKDITPENFIDPPYETPSGFKKRFPNPLVMMMLRDDAISQQQGELGILIAEPGQGKTFTARHIVSDLCTRDMIPIYIDSQQWSSLPPEELSSIWKTISHSFRYFDSSIDWIDGCEEIFLNATMKAGIFRLVFDGFDEYILWNRGKVDANDALQRLSKLVEETGAPVLVTSRTSFWTSDISHEFVSGLKAQPSIFKIIPFDRNHAGSYFKARFEQNEIKTKRALSIYDKLRKYGKGDDASNFAGRGFILYLIADLADSSDFSLSDSGEGSNVIQWVMKSLCQREQTRQKLPINADVQLEIFREMAEAIACGEKITTPLLYEIVGICATGIDTRMIDDLVSGSKDKRGSFHDHPLVRKDMATEEWVFVHEQLFYNLLAEQILLYTTGGAESLHNLFTRISTTIKLRTLILEIATCLVAQITAIPEEDAALKKIADVIQALLGCSKAGTDIHDSVKLEKLLCSTIALLSVNYYMPPGCPRKDRTDFLKKIVQSPSIEGIHFNGSISSMDFAETTFKNCRFDNVMWANCKFSETTVFESCHFLGGNIQKCEGFGLSHWKREVFDSEASALINAERIAAGKKRYSEENLRADIDSVIKKFIPKEGVGMKTVIEEHIGSGIISKSIHRDKITSALIRFLFEKHNVSGVTGAGYHVKETAKQCVAHYAINGVYTGPLNEVYQELSREFFDSLK